MAYHLAQEARAGLSEFGIPAVFGIRDYIERNDSLCILLSATPYNKTYLDLSTQFGLFLHEDADIGIRPEKLIARLGGEHEFIRRHQCPVRSLAAFDKSEDPDDWRDLMRLYMVRRTRGFIMQHYAHKSAASRGLRKLPARAPIRPLWSGVSRPNRTVSTTR